MPVIASASAALKSGVMEARSAAPRGKSGRVKVPARGGSSTEHHCAGAGSCQALGTRKNPRTPFDRNARAALWLALKQASKEKVPCALSAVNSILGRRS